MTAELPTDLARWATALRRIHYPPERNVLDAHVTLFRALPPSAEAEIRDALSRQAGTNPAPAGCLDGLMSLGGGTALNIASPAMLEIRAQLAEQFHGLLTAQDNHSPRLHITIQNKVSTKAAKALKEQLAVTLRRRDFAFRGLALHVYRGGPWEFVKNWPFRG